MGFIKSGFWRFKHVVASPNRVAYLQIHFPEPICVCALLQPEFLGERRACRGWQPCVHLLENGITVRCPCRSLVLLCRQWGWTRRTGTARETRGEQTWLFSGVSYQNILHFRMDWLPVGQYYFQCGANVGQFWSRQISRVNMPGVVSLGFMPHMHWSIFVSVCSGLGQLRFNSD